MEYYLDKFCGCGCGESIEEKAYHKYQVIPVFVHGHNRRTKPTIKIPDIYPLCKCGCGERIEAQLHHNSYKIPEYIHGHNNRGKHFSTEHKEKISKANLGKYHPPLSAKARAKIGVASKARVRKPHSEEAKAKMSAALKGRKHGPCSEETKAKIGAAQKGPKNHQWLGGLSNEPYPFDFDKNLKESIRERDNHTCQLCEKHQTELGRKLSVHHIDYDKENIDPDNLLSLCPKCHSKTNFNRKFWIEFFTKHEEVELWLQPTR